MIKCMQSYFNDWKFKHPQPNDLRKIFEEETGKDLNWFFDDLIKTTKKTDYKIAGSKKDTANPDHVLLKIRNKGEIHGPFSISGVKDGKIIATQWYEPIADKSFVSFKKEDFDNYRIDAQLDIPEIKRKNNTLKTKSLLRTTEPLRLQWIGSIEDPDKTQLFFTPFAGWNMNDKGMLGMAFYNSTIPAKRFEYVLAPMYAFDSENINGYASAYYHIMPNSVFQDIELGAKASSFSYLRFNSQQNSSGKEVPQYYKIAPSINFDLKKRSPRQFGSVFIKLENVNIFKEITNYTKNENGENIYSLNLEKYYVNVLTIGLKNTHPINPFYVTASFEQADDFVKLDLTANYRFAYKKKQTGLNIRIFIGRFLYNDYANNRFNYNLSGNSDYLYNQIYLGRNTIGSFLNQQFAITDGGFKNQTDITSGDRWLDAINIKSNLFTKYISTYADFGLIGFSARNDKGDEIDKVSAVTYDGGLSLNVVPGIFEIYFPVIMSSDLNQLKYAEKIRFTLNINLLNPFKMIRKFDL